MTNSEVQSFQDLTEKDLSLLDKELLSSLLIDLIKENERLRELCDRKNSDDSKTSTFNHNKRTIDKKDNYSHRETIIDIKECAHNDTAIDQVENIRKESIDEFVYKLPTAINIHAEHTPGKKGDMVLTFLEGKFSYTVPNDFDAIYDENENTNPKYAYLYVAVKKADRRVPIGCFRLKEGVVEMQLIANINE